jgi:short-subunit dehydrogenase
MSRSLSERYGKAFVTGASSGLGLAFSEMLLASGVRVWGTSRDRARLAALARPGGAFTPVALDLAGPDAESAYDAAAREAGGAFDLMINNAGYGLFGPFDATDAGEWEAQVRSMLVVTLRLAHRAYAAMRKRDRGCLVNVSSLAVLFPLPFMSGYNVCKAGLSALSESLIAESRGSGVTVIDFRPGDYRTAFNERMRPRFTAAQTERAWRTLDANLRSAPPPARAAADLRRALLRGRSGVVRSGGFFQARLAPLLARLAPPALVRAGVALYFGGR